jgi:hypothetical protein
MSIIVVCPGCRKSFNVADKFAGRTGPCPNCKKPIRVPTKAEEVKIEAPAEFSSGGRSISGKLLTKPIARIQAKFQPVMTAIIVASVLVVLAVAWAMGSVFRENTSSAFIASAIGLLIVSLPLAMAAYSFLRNADFEPYSGKALYLRAGLCSLGYVILWGMFAFLASPEREIITGDLWNWVFVIPPFVAIGGLIAMSAFDLEYGDAIFHYSFYLVATLLLRWAVGMQWVWNLKDTLPS